MKVDNKKENNEQNPNNFIKGVSSIASGVLQRLSISSISSIMHFNAYLLSYLKYFDDSYKLQHGYFLMPFYTLSAHIFTFIGGILDNKLGGHRAMIIGSLFIVGAAGVILISKNLYLDYFGIVLYGVGVGFSKLTTSKNACRFFPGHRGTVAAVITGLASFGGAGFNLIGEMLINPDGVGAKENKFYPFEIGERIKYYLIFQMCVVGLLTLLSLLFYVPYQTTNIEIENITQENRQEANAISEKEESDQDIIETNDDKNLPLSGRINPDDYSIKSVYKALRTWKLWRLFLIYSLTNFVISMISTTYRAISIAKG